MNSGKFQILYIQGQENEILTRSDTGFDWKVLGRESFTVFALHAF